MSPLRELRLARVAREATALSTRDAPGLAPARPAASWRSAPGAAVSPPGNVAALALPPDAVGDRGGLPHGLADIPTLFERVHEPDESSECVPRAPREEQSARNDTARIAKTRGPLMLPVRAALGRCASASSARLFPPRRLAAVAACCLAGFALLDMVAGAQGERTLQAQRDRARAVRETLELLDRAGPEPRLKSAAVTFSPGTRAAPHVLESSLSASVAAAGDDTIAAKVQGQETHLAAEAPSTPDPRSTGSGTPLGNGAPRQASRGSEALAGFGGPAMPSQDGRPGLTAPVKASLSAAGAPQLRRSERIPLGRYLDGTAGAGASPGVEVDQAVSGRQDPLRSAFIKAEVTAARAPFRIIDIREQQSGPGAQVAEGIAQAPVWVHAGHMFPNGWTVVDVTPNAATFLSPEGRVIRMQPDVAEQTPR